MDRYCRHHQRKSIVTEEFSVTVFGLPPSFEDEALETLQEMGGDELAEELPNLRHDLEASCSEPN